MFEEYNTHQISNTQNIGLREKLDHFGIDLKTTYEVSEEARENSFFNSLIIPSFESFVERKTNGEKFSYSEFKQKESELANRFDRIKRFKDDKLSKHIDTAVINAKNKAMSMFSRTDKIVMEMFKDSYACSYNSSYFGTPDYYWTLDTIIKFYIDYIKRGFPDSLLIERAASIIGNRYDTKSDTWESTKDISIFSLYRIFVMYSKNLNANFIETVYDLQHSLDMLRLVIKRNPALKAFKNKPKLLVDLVRYDNRHYSKWSYGSDYHTNLKLTKTQAIQFAEFYLTTKDKRLNTENVINELCLHLRKYGEQELIEKLVLNHHRVYSSVIAGDITMDSYSSHSKAFLRYILSDDGYENFCDLVQTDDREKFSNAIKVGL